MSSDPAARVHNRHVLCQRVGGRQLERWKDPKKHGDVTRIGNRQNASIAIFKRAAAPKAARELEKHCKHHPEEWNRLVDNFLTEFVYRKKNTRANLTHGIFIAYGCTSCQYEAGFLPSPHIFRSHSQIRLDCPALTNAPRANASAISPGSRRFSNCPDCSVHARRPAARFRSFTSCQ